LRFSGKLPILKWSLSLFVALVANFYEITLNYEIYIYDKCNVKNEAYFQQKILFCFSSKNLLDNGQLSGLL